MDAIYTTQKEQFDRTIRVFPSMEAMHAFNKNRLEEKAKRAASKKEKEAKAPEAKATVTTKVEIVSESVVDAIAVAAEVSADATVAAPAEPIVETDAADEHSSKSVKRTTTKKKTKDSVK